MNSSYRTDPAPEHPARGQLLDPRDPDISPPPRLGATHEPGISTRTVVQAGPRKDSWSGPTPGARTNGHASAPNSDALREVAGTLPPRHAVVTTPRKELPTNPEIDLARAARAVSDLLDALRVDRNGEGLADTPCRVARGYAELLTPEPFEATTFANDEGYDELVVARSIPFSSLCEHHLLPFTGVAHVGYVPAARLLGLSKLARVVAHFSHRLQVQELLTTQVARWLEEILRPKGVGVILEAEHACMSLRGVRTAGSVTLTSALAGLVRDDQRTRAEFFSVVGCRP